MLFATLQHWVTRGAQYTRGHIKVEALWYDIATAGTSHVTEVQDCFQWSAHAQTGPLRPEQFPQSATQYSRTWARPSASLRPSWSLASPTPPDCCRRTVDCTYRSQSLCRRLAWHPVAYCRYSHGPLDISRHKPSKLHPPQPMRIFFHQRQWDLS